MIGADDFKAYVKIVEIIDAMDADNWLLIMPDEFEGLDLIRLKRFKDSNFEHIIQIFGSLNIL